MLSYFKFVSETLKDSGLRKFLSPTTFPRVTLSISSSTPSLILVISGRDRIELLSNFVNIQPEESYERRGRTGENQKNARVLRTFWKKVKRSLPSPTVTQLKTKNCKICEKTFGGKQPLKRQNLFARFSTEKFDTQLRSRK